MEPRHQFSYKPCELGLQNIVPLPTECVNKGVLKKFSSSKDSTITSFTYLLQYTAKDAILDKTPTFTKYDFQGHLIKILNYTTTSITVSKNKEIFFNYFQSGYFDNYNCSVVAYNVKGLSDIIFLEQKDDEYKSKVKPRNFIIKDTMGCYRWGYLTPSKNPNLLFSSQHYTQMNNLSEIISKDLNLKILLKNIPEDADLTNPPELLYFSARINSCFFTILNYTNHQITFDICANLYINGQEFTNFANENCQVVAYHKKNHFQTINFLQKEVKHKKLGSTIVANMVWERTIT